MRVGVDIADSDEIGRLAERERFRALVFTPAELALGATYGPRRRAEYLTGRFAAKEAVSKVLGTGFGRDLMWRDIEVLAGDTGEPAVHLHRRAATVASERGLGDLAVSISHKRPWAIAVAASAA
jgi:holo-[acyl-carrier protein] synthase